MSESFSEYWSRLILANPSLLTHDTIKMDVRQFKRQLERAYQAGSVSSGEPESLREIFGRMFR